MISSLGPFGHLLAALQQLISLFNNKMERRQDDTNNGETDKANEDESNQSSSSDRSEQSDE